MELHGLSPFPGGILPKDPVLNAVISSQQAERLSQYHAGFKDERGRDEGEEEEGSKVLLPVWPNHHRGLLALLS